MEVMQTSWIIWLITIFSTRSWTPSILVGSTLIETRNSKINISSKPMYHHQPPIKQSVKNFLDLSICSSKDRLLQLLWPSLAYMTVWRFSDGTLSSIAFPCNKTVCWGWTIPKNRVFMSVETTKMTVKRWWRL